MLDTSNIPFIPPEIHLVVAQYLHRDDLPHYRLACRLFSRLGLPELYHTIIFRPSTASIERLDNIRRNAVLAALVSTLSVDTTLWRVGADVRDWHEWTSHCKSRANSADAAKVILYKELAASRQHWEAYLSRRDDERDAWKKIAKWKSESLTFHCMLPNLRKIHVVKDNHQASTHHNRARAEYAMIPVSVALDAWKGDSFSKSDDHYHKIMDLTALNAKRWQFDGFTVSDMHMLSLSLYQASRGTYEEDHKSVSMTIHLGVQKAARSPRNPQFFRKDWFPQFLNRWRNLENVDIDLGSQHRSQISSACIQTVHDAFEISGTAYLSGACVTWPRLRKLSLSHFDTTPGALLSFIGRHSSTLRDLELHDLWLRPEGSDFVTSHTWREIFQIIESTAQLASLKLTGKFRDINMEVWDFEDADLATRVGTWVTNGGECPLTGTIQRVCGPTRA